MGAYTDISSLPEHDNLISSNTYVLLDFTATWCPPCRTIGPIFEKIAQEHASEGNLAFAKVDVDAMQGLAAQYNISAMPTFILVQNGTPVQIARGANAPAILAMVKTALDATEDVKKQDEPNTEATEKETVI